MKISELIPLLKQLPQEANIYEVFFDAGILGVHSDYEKPDCFFFPRNSELDIDPLDFNNPEHIEKLKEILDERL